MEYPHSNEWLISKGEVSDRSEMVRVTSQQSDRWPIVPLTSHTFTLSLSFAVPSGCVRDHGSRNTTESRLIPRAIVVKSLDGRTCLHEVRAAGVYPVQKQESWARTVASSRKQVPDRFDKFSTTRSGTERPEKTDRESRGISLSLVIRYR